MSSLRSLRFGSLVHKRTDQVKQEQGRKLGRYLKLCTYIHEKKKTRYNGAQPNVHIRSIVRMNKMGTICVRVLIQTIANIKKVTTTNSPIAGMDDDEMLWRSDLEMDSHEVKFTNAVAEITYTMENLTLDHEKYMSNNVQMKGGVEMVENRQQEVMTTEVVTVIENNRESSSEYSINPNIKSRYPLVQGEIVTMDTIRLGMFVQSSIDEICHVQHYQSTDKRKKQQKGCTNNFDSITAMPQYRETLSLEELRVEHYRKKEYQTLRMGRTGIVIDLDLDAGLTTIAWICSDLNGDRYQNHQGQGQGRNTNSVWKLIDTETRMHFIRNQRAIFQSHQVGVGNQFWRLQVGSPVRFTTKDKPRIIGLFSASSLQRQINRLRDNNANVTLDGIEHRHLTIGTVIHDSTIGKVMIANLDLRKDQVFLVLIEKIDVPTSNVCTAQRKPYQRCGHDGSSDIRCILQSRQ